MPHSETGEIGGLCHATFRRAGTGPEVSCPVHTSGRDLQPASVVHRKRLGEVRVPEGDINLDFMATFGLPARLSSDTSNTLPVLSAVRWSGFDHGQKCRRSINRC
jgi:hypothetical protein